MVQFRTLDNLDPAQKVILVRADLNVPMQEGKVTDQTRIERLIPTITDLGHRNARIVLLSHFGRPKGQYRKEDSLKQILQALTEAFDQPVLFAPDCIGEVAETAIQSLKPGEILLLENLRYHPEEEANDSAFAKKLAQFGDAYVNDAFSCSHRAHASVVAITKFLPSYAGRGMQAELEALSQVMGNPRRPLMAIVAGSKVSTKLELLKNLIHKVDKLVVGGGMANTFLSAQNYPIGQSLFEADMLPTARDIIVEAESAGCEIVLPQDVAVTEDIKPQTSRCVVAVKEVSPFHKIVDIGETTIAQIREKLAECATVVWNGPVGIFELPPFDVGTTEIARYIADLTKKGKLISVAGGGDTLAALAHAGCGDRFTYTSTAGGAFLEWLEGKTLPGVKALEEGIWLGC